MNSHDPEMRFPESVLPMTLTRLCAVFLAAQLAFAPLMAQMPAASSERDYSIGPDTWPNILHAFRMPDEPYVEE
ncbi:MAG: hypothetical protein F4X39_04865, partial [Acidobacteriia bacterium]|nr:hypothetical protein [Terriglobia bacterium]